MEWYEVAFDKLYPILYGHRDEDEARRAAEVFGPYLEGRGPVLDLASGDGRYLRALEELGIDAFGLDLSHYLLAASVDAGGQGRCVVQGDMRHLPFVDGSFGAVINMFTSFGYFSVDTDNLLVFREVHRILKTTGVFLFDFINAGRISSDLLGDSRRNSGGYDIRERRRIEGHGKYLVKRATITDTKSDLKESIEERLRLYTRGDLLTMFKSLDFTVCDTYGDYKGNAFVEGVSERLIMILEKR